MNFLKEKLKKIFFLNLILGSFLIPNSHSEDYSRNNPISWKKIFSTIVKPQDFGGIKAVGYELWVDKKSISTEGTITRFSTQKVIVDEEFRPIYPPTNTPLNIKSDTWSIDCFDNSYSTGKGWEKIGKNDWEVWNLYGFVCKNQIPEDTSFPNTIYNAGSWVKVFSIIVPQSKREEMDEGVIKGTTPAGVTLWADESSIIKDKNIASIGTFGLLINEKKEYLTPTFRLEITDTYHFNCRNVSYSFDKVNFSSINFLKNAGLLKLYDLACNNKIPK